jgi:hypothetical protein
VIGLARGFKGAYQRSSRLRQPKASRAPRLTCGLQLSSNPAGGPAILVIENKKAFAFIDDHEIAMRFLDQISLVALWRVIQWDNRASGWDLALSLLRFRLPASGRLRASN